jgi:hypothetical protein
MPRMPALKRPFRLKTKRERWPASIARRMADIQAGSLMNRNLRKMNHVWHAILPEVLEVTDSVGRKAVNSGVANMKS